MVTLDKVFDILDKAGQVERYSKNLKFENMELNHLSYNSKDIKEKTLFICKGSLFKTEYLEDAIGKGAVCYVSEKVMTDKIPGIISGKVTLKNA